jgi:hypothetical protein
MATYKIWCKEPDGQPGSDQANMISAMDWGEVQGTTINVTDANSLSQITNADTLRVFAHGSIDKVGGMTAKALGTYLYDHGLRQANVVELVACDTAVNSTFKASFASRLLEHMVTNNRIAITTGTKGAIGSLAPSRDGHDAVTVTDRSGRTTDFIGDAGKKSYSLEAGCFGLKVVST